MTGFIGVGQLRYILTNLGEKMSDDEVDELLKAVDTSSGEINYTGMFRSSPFTFCGDGKRDMRSRADSDGRSRTHDSRELDPPSYFLHSLDDGAVLEAVWLTKRGYDRIG